MVSRVVLDLVERVGRLAVADTARVPVQPDDADAVAAWCERTGNSLVSIDGSVATVRRGRAGGGESAAVPHEPDQAGVRLWLYTNFDCNLACDYCCVSSSPKT